jgi:hypothetical protein
MMPRLRYHFSDDICQPKAFHVRDIAARSPGDKAISPHPQPGDGLRRTMPSSTEVKATPSKSPMAVPPRSLSMHADIVDEPNHWEISFDVRRRHSLLDQVLTE